MALHHLVRVGALGHVGRFTAVDAVRYPRDSRVVVRTGRGLELGEVFLVKELDHRSPVPLRYRGRGILVALGGKGGQAPVFDVPVARADDRSHLTLVYEDAEPAKRPPLALGPLFQGTVYSSCGVRPAGARAVIDGNLVTMHLAKSKIPAGAELRPILSSDLGHWDAGELDGILPAAWSLVEDGLLDEEQFSSLVWRNPARLFLGANPRFFAETALDGAPLPQEAGKA